METDRSEHQREMRDRSEMTVTEMTRRRDHWREVAHRVEMSYIQERDRADNAQHQVVILRNRGEAFARRIAVLERDLAAAQAETRKYAEALGNLRSQRNWSDSHGN